MDSKLEQNGLKRIIMETKFCFIESVDFGAIKETFGVITLIILNTNRKTKMNVFGIELEGDEKHIWQINHN